jgi:hypothetical protein
MLVAASGTRPYPATGLDSLAVLLSNSGCEHALGQMAQHAVGDAASPWTDTLRHHWRQQLGATAGGHSVGRR